MINTHRLIYSSVLVTMIFMLSGCGESDTNTASAPATAPETVEKVVATETTSAADAEVDTPFDISTVEKAEGVVYQDEIYANWPYN